MADLTIDDTIDGKRFNTYGARVKLAKASQVRQYESIDPDKKTTKLGKALCYAACPFKLIAQGAQWAWNNSDAATSNYHKRRLGFEKNLNYVGLTDPESKETHKILKDLWAEYKNKVKFKIKDVASMYIKVPLKEGKPRALQAPG